MRHNKFEAAIQNMRKGISILEQVGNPRKIWESRAALASAFEKMGKVSEAREEWGNANSVIQNVVSGLSDLKLREGFLSAKPVRDIMRNAV